MSTYLHVNQSQQLTDDGATTMNVELEQLDPTDIFYTLSSVVEEYSLPSRLLAK